MQRIVSGMTLTTVILLALTLSLTQFTYAGGHHEKHGSTPMQEEATDAPIKMTMEELHETGGVPPGWTFKLPEGDPEAGRQVYIEMKCYTCHRIAGDKFPTVKPDEKKPGPDLTGMGAHHPTEYFAETIVNPNRIVVLGEGYTGLDGLSIMPEYNDTLTLQQWIDLTMYLKSLGGPIKHKGMEHTGKQ